MIDERRSQPVTNMILKYLPWTSRNIHVPRHIYVCACLHGIASSCLWICGASIYATLLCSHRHYRGSCAVVEVVALFQGPSYEGYIYIYIYIYTCITVSMYRCPHAYRYATGSLAACSALRIQAPMNSSCTEVISQFPRPSGPACKKCVISQQ